MYGLLEMTFCQMTLPALQRNYATLRWNSFMNLLATYYCQLGYGVSNSRV